MWSSSGVRAIVKEIAGTPSDGSAASAARPSRSYSEASIWLTQTYVATSPGLTSVPMAEEGRRGKVRRG
jgi:hypothetical protein